MFTTFYGEYYKYYYDHFTYKMISLLNCSCLDIYIINTENNNYKTFLHKTINNYDKKYNYITHMNSIICMLHINRPIYIVNEISKIIRMCLYDGTYDSRCSRYLSTELSNS